MDVFTSPSMPFYKFSDILFLSKIALPHLTDFIVERFSATKKNISPAQAERIARLVECHPYYAQQLAQLVWLRTSKTAKDKSIDEAIEGLTLQLSLLFQSITEGLSTTKVNFSEIILSGETQLSSKQNIEKYKLGTSTNVVRVKKALINKEIIDEHKREITILDPIYSRWLREYYFIAS